MASTDNYKQSAPLYQEAFDNQNRAETPSVIDSGQQFDRDNLLHFIEDKFKSNVRGGISIFNLRALFHTMVKSFSNIKDDNRRNIPFFFVSGRFGAYYSTRYYLGSSTYGLTTSTWSTYSSNPTTSGVSKSYLNSSLITSFPLEGVSVKGQLKMTTSSGTGDVIEVSLGYCEPDDGLSSPSSHVVTMVGSSDTMLSVLNDVYTFSFDCTETIPPNKCVLLFFRNTTHPGNSTIYTSFSASVNYKG